MILAVQNAETLLFHRPNRDCDSLNYIFIPKDQKLNDVRKGPKTEFDGYVINSSDHLTYVNSGNYMTIERAKKFLLSLQGYVDPNLDFTHLCRVCLGCHYCEKSSALAVTSGIQQSVPIIFLFVIC